MGLMIFMSVMTILGLSSNHINNIEETYSLSRETLILNETTPSMDWNKNESRIIDQIKNTQQIQKIAEELKIKLETEARIAADEHRKQLEIEKHNSDLEEAGFFINNPIREYRDETMWVRIGETLEANQHYFTVEINLKDNNRLHTAFAQNEFWYGFSTTSEIAKENNAILAINASGFSYQLGTAVGPVIRDGVAYNEVTDHLAAMAISWEGDMWNANENAWTSELAELGAKHTFRFGPSLLNDYQKLDIDPKYNSRAGANPRTAIGQRGNKNWFIIVAEGRKEDAKGLTLSELQDIFMDAGCRVAYNLDGGGSTSLYFQGEILNEPSDGTERKIADIIYFK